MNAAPAPANDDVVRPKTAKPELHRFGELCRLWSKAPIYLAREAAALSALITAADAATGMVNGPRRPERYGLAALCKAAHLSRSGFLRAMEVLADPDRAGDVTRSEPERTSSKTFEYTVYTLHPDRLAHWATFTDRKQRPKSWDPPKKPRGGGSVTVELPPTASCVPPANADRLDLPGKPRGGGSVTTCAGPAPGACRPRPPTPGPPPPSRRSPGLELQLGPTATPATIAELAAGRPEDEELAVLALRAAAGHPWCVTVAKRVLERDGGAITDPERQRLREIGQEQAAPKRGRASSRQPTGGWRPGGSS